jgi:hypothetical protein
MKKTFPELGHGKPSHGHNGMVVNSISYFFSRKWSIFEELKIIIGESLDLNSISLVYGFGSIVISIAVYVYIRKCYGDTLDHFVVILVFFGISENDNFVIIQYVLVVLI